MNSNSHSSGLRREGLIHQLSGGTINGTSYTYNAAGNRTTKTDLPGAVTSAFSYDPAYQLTQVMQGTTQTEAYTYDPVGNRTYQPGAPYTYNTSNEMLTREGVPYTYDNDGNLLSKTNGSGTTSYAWDFENRMTSVTLPGTGGTITYEYDPFGRRIYKATPSGTVIYVYDGDNISEELNAAGAVQERYTYGPGVDEPLVGQRQPKIVYYEADGLGSITSLTDPTGATAATYTYNSFGFLTHSTGSATNWRRYTAREFDSETGLYFNRARYYDATVGRFINEDPLGTNAGTNAYEYVMNGPTDFTDSTGDLTQVAIGGPVGDNLFGHASLIINGQVFSYGTNYTDGAPGTKDWGANAQAFLNTQDGFRSTDLLTLDISQQQEGTLLQYLSDHNPYAAGSPAYNVVGNSCVSQSENALVNTGIETILNSGLVPGCAGGECMPLTAATTPQGLETNLFLQTGLVSQTTTVGNQSVGYWSSFWGTLWYGLSRSTH